MFTKILNDNEVNKFNEITGMKVMKVFISKNKKYYYATIVDKSLKVRISKELANKFI